MSQDGVPIDGYRVHWFTRLRHNPNFALAVVTFALFLDYLMLLTMIPVIPVYGERLGLSQTQIGAIFAVKPALGILFSPVMGWLSDRVGRRIPMIAGMFASAGFIIMFAFARNFETLFIARCLQGTLPTYQCGDNLDHFI